MAGDLGAEDDSRWVVRLLGRESQFEVPHAAFIDRALRPLEVDAPLVDVLVCGSCSHSPEVHVLDFFVVL